MNLFKIGKQTFLAAVTMLLMSDKIVAQLPAIVVVSNRTLSRTDELITLPRATIDKRFHLPPNFVAVFKNDKEFPVQYVDNNSDGKWDEAIFLYSFRAGETVNFKVTAVNINRAKSAQKAHVRLRKKNADDTFGPYITKEVMPLRNPATDFSKQRLPMYLTEGPAWENDKVAFRLYFDVRNNKDIYGKTTSKMMMDTVGVDNKTSYHEPAPWGMDILHVVKSLGAGALALSIPQQGARDTLIRLGGDNIMETTFQQVADGPLLARFIVTYDWLVNNKLLKLREEISIRAGQYFYDSKVTIKGSPPGAKLVTGIANFYQNNFKVINEGKAVVGYSYGKQSENKDNLGLGILVDKATFIKADLVNTKNNTDINETYIIAQKVDNDSRLYYRFYACWEKTDDRFKTFVGVKDFLIKEAIKFSHPIQIKWKR